MVLQPLISFCHDSVVHQLLCLWCTQSLAVETNGVDGIGPEADEPNRDHETVQRLHNDIRRHCVRRFRWTQAAASPQPYFSMTLSSLTRSTSSQQHVPCANTCTSEHVWVGPVWLGAARGLA